MTNHHLRVLDVSVVLSGPDDVLAPIVRAYGRFLAQDPAPAGAHEIRIESARAATLEDGPTTVPVIAGVSPTMQVYQRFLHALFDRVATHAVLHAGALIDRRGEALLIAGPSGFGKSSLTLELLYRGLAFLSDDYAPIDFSSGKVAPYPRTVGLLPDGSAKTPQPFLDAAANSEHPRLHGKALIDVGEVLGEAVMATAAAPLGNVVLLDAGDGTGAHRSVVHLGVWPPGEAEAEAVIGRVSGVEILDRTDRDDITVWSLELDHQRLPTEQFSDLLERDFVAFSESRPSVAPDFRSEPRLTPVKRREMALLLCREIQNRRPRGRLMRQYKGDTAALFLDVATALASARAFRLQVGNFQSTADLLEELAR